MSLHILFIRSNFDYNYGLPIVDFQAPKMGVFSGAWYLVLSSMPTELTAHSQTTSTARSHAFWRVLEHATDGYALFSMPERRVTACNPAWRKRLTGQGMEKKSLEIQVWDVLQECDHEECSNAARWLTLESNEVHTICLGCTHNAASPGEWLLIWPTDHLSSEDIVTGVAERRTLQTELDARFRSGRCFAVLFVDLDGFKQVNDQLGHAAGDATLRQIAQRIRACLREVDLVGRFGGDEFVVLVDGAKTEDDLLAVVDRINQSVAAPLDNAPTDANLSASIGWAFAPDGRRDASELLAAADAHMYAQKRLRDASKPGS